MIERALDAITGGLDRLADEMGVSYNAIWSWKHGKRNPSADNMRRLATVLRNRSSDLSKLADQLDRAAAERE